MADPCPICLTDEVELTWTTECCGQMYHYACFRRSLDSPRHGFARCPTCRRQVFRTSPHKVIPSQDTPSPTATIYPSCMPRVQPHPALINQARQLTGGLTPDSELQRYLQPYFPLHGHFSFLILRPFVTNSGIGTLSRPLYELILKIQYMRGLPSFRFHMYPRQIFLQDFMRDEQLLFGRLEDQAVGNSLLKFEEGEERKFNRNQMHRIDRLKWMLPVINRACRLVLAIRGDEWESLCSNASVD